MKCHAWEECGGTYSRRWHVEEVPAVIFHHLIDAIIVSYVKCRVLVCCVKVSGGVLKWISSNFADWQGCITVVDDP